MYLKKMKKQSSNYYIQIKLQNTQSSKYIIDEQHNKPFKMVVTKQWISMVI